MKWNFDEMPPEPGCYPVLVCYDAEEGSFPAAAVWHGKTWDRRAVVAYGSLCASAKEAEQMAYANDPDRVMAERQP